MGNPIESNGVTQNPWFWATIIVLGVVLILYLSGVLKRLKDFSLNLFKGFHWNMKFHDEKNDSRPTPMPSTALAKPEAATSRQGKGSRSKRQKKKQADAAKLQSEINSVLKENRDTMPALPPDFEKQQLEKGNALLDEHHKNPQLVVLVDAKKYFEAARQLNPKSVGANFGLAQIFERWKDPRRAQTYFWETVRSSELCTHPLAVEAKRRLEEISRQEYFQNMMRAAIKKGPTKTDFWFPQIPTAEKLAKYLAALSNYDSGGTIMIGIDKVTGNSLGADFDEWKAIWETTCFEYLTAPCVVEPHISHDPKGIFIIVQKGLDGPYRVANGKIAKVFIVDADGKMREATPEEADAFGKNKRS